jgi:uncharacterized protein (TIGR03067 family)
MITLPYFLDITMKTPLLMFVAAGLVLATTSEQAGDQQDLQKLQGTWKLVSAMQDGKPLPDEKVKQTTIVFQGDSFRFPGSAEYATSKEGTIKIDPTKKPKQMDATSTQGEVMLGIYDLSGDRYKVCFAPAGKARPAEFASKSGSGQILQFWSRARKQ